MKLGLNNKDGYVSPINLHYIGQPFLYFGFIPADVARITALQGLWVKTKSFTQNARLYPNIHNYIVISL